eukprot:gene16519-19613_t
MFGDELTGAHHQSAHHYYALCLPTRSLGNEVWTLLETKWADAEGNVFMPQRYHLDCRDERENLKLWPEIDVSGVGGAGIDAKKSSATANGEKKKKKKSSKEEQHEEELEVVVVPSVVLTISRDGAFATKENDSSSPSVANESSSSGNTRCLLRLTNAGAAAVMDDSGGLRTALQSLLATGHDYIRLMRGVLWPEDDSRRKYADDVSDGNNTCSPTAMSIGVQQPHQSLSELCGPKKAFKPFRFCELFAGLGGFRIALQALGGECVFASDIDPITQAVYCGRWGETMFSNSESGEGHMHGDITKVLTAQIPDHDLLVGGFPCQPFSRLGNQLGFADQTGGQERGILYLEILRILREKKPKMFLLENVPGIADPTPAGDGGYAGEQQEGLNSEPSVGFGHKRDRTDDYWQHDPTSKKARSWDISSSAARVDEDECGITAKQLSPLDTILADLGLEGYYHVKAKIYSSAPLTAQARRRVYFVGVLREEGQKRRKIRFPDSIEPDLGLCAKDVLRFEPAASGTDAAISCTTVSSKQNDGKGAWNCLTAEERAARALRLSPPQLWKLYAKLPSLQKQGKKIFLYPDTSKIAPVVSHYGHSPGHGVCQLVARPSSSVEGGAPRVMAREECLRVMGMKPGDFLPMLETEWIPSVGDPRRSADDKGRVAANGKGGGKKGGGGPTMPHLMVKKAAYKVIGNAVCPPVIAWICEKVVLPAGGFVDKSHSTTSSEDDSVLPVYLQLALDAVL